MVRQLLHQPDADSADGGDGTRAPDARHHGVHRKSRRELSPAAASLTVADKLAMMEKAIGKRVIDAVVVGPSADTRGVTERLIVREPLEAADIRYRHDRQLLRALEHAIQAV